MIEPSAANQSVAPDTAKGFRGFVERHDALFTVFGAGLVALGFIVNEGYREKAKDLAASLRNANEEFTVQNYLAAISEGVADVRTTQDFPEGLTPAAIKKAHSDPDVDTTPHYQLASRLVGEEETKYQIATRLLADLPEQPNALKAFDTQVKADIKSLQGRMDELVNADLSGHPNKVDTSNPNNLLVKQESTLVTNALFHFFDTESRVNTDNFNYSEALRGEAERQSKLAERKVDISTYASYALFGIGWFLGLIGKLLKLPVLGGAATE